MLSVTDLLNLTKKPKRKFLSLQTIQQFYKEHLCDRVFIFETDNTERPIIKLRFKEEHLCHLLGFQYLFDEKRFGKTYIGEDGYNLIQDGTVTFEFIENTNPNGLPKYENRILFFPFVHQILQNPKSIVFLPENVPFKSKLKADLIFYNHLNKRYVHLGLDRFKKRPQNYYPKSFFERRDKNFIDGQTEINIISTNTILDKKTP
jgi:phage-Barnase-EndoU-ColicinE5/D-RelE like nuclease4